MQKQLQSQAKKESLFFQQIEDILTQYQPQQLSLDIQKIIINIFNSHLPEMNKTIELTYSQLYKSIKNCKQNIDQLALQKTQPNVKNQLTNVVSKYLVKIINNEDMDINQQQFLKMINNAQTTKIQFFIQDYLRQLGKAYGFNFISNKCFINHWTKNYSEEFYYGLKAACLLRFGQETWNNFLMASLIYTEGCKPHNDPQAPQTPLSLLFGIILIKFMNEMRYLFNFEFVNDYYVQLANENNFLVQKLQQMGFKPNQSLNLPVQKVQLNGGSLRTFKKNLRQSDAKGKLKKK